MTPPARPPWSGYPPNSVLVPPGRRSSTAHLVIAWVLAVLTLLYLLPWAIAASRNKDDVVAIALINFLLGWSLIGWVAALVMACTGGPPAQVVLVYHQMGTALPGPPQSFDVPFARQASAPPREFSPVYDRPQSAAPPRSYGPPQSYRPPPGTSEPTVVLDADGYRGSPQLEVTRPLPIYTDDPQNWRRD